MKEILKAYKFRIEPTKEQEVLLNKHFGSVRFVFNFFLNHRKEQYQSSKKSDNYYVQASKLTELKKLEETCWLKEINSQTLQVALKNLEASYLNFFRGTSKFPRFKSKKDKNSFRVPQHISVENGRIQIPKFKEGIKIIEHRKIEGEIKQCTFSKSSTGKFYVSILVQLLHEQSDKTGNLVGIDLGIKDFAITSDGKKFKNNRYTKRYSTQLKKAQQHLSRKQKGSRQCENQRLKVARIHEKITNTRKDTLHKVSHTLVKSYDLIALEDLNVKGMVKNHKLAKHIQDASWGEFVRMIEYKASWNDKTTVEISRWFPSSKSCYECGWINQSLSLNDREWVCQECGCVHDRDVNASKNILKEGLRNLSAGTVDYTGGDDVRLSNEQLSVKSEAHGPLDRG